MYERFAELLKEKGITSYRISKEISISQSTLSDWKKGKSTPKADKLQLIANYLDVSLDYLVGKTDVRHTATESQKENILTKKDERDIQKKIQSILDDLDNQEDALMYNGEPLELDDITRELLRNSLENGLRIAKIKAKEKYTPKKYR